MGRSAREAVPRGSHASWQPQPNRFDPVQLLDGQAATRVPDLVPIRYGRMLSSPFAFFRGAALLMAADLADTPRTALRVQLCGDAHLSNVRNPDSSNPGSLPPARPVRLREQALLPEPPESVDMASRYGQANDTLFRTREVFGLDPRKGAVHALGQEPAGIRRVVPPQEIRVFPAQQDLFHLIISKNSVARSI